MSRVRPQEMYELYVRPGLKKNNCFIIFSVCRLDTPLEPHGRWTMDISFNDHWKSVIIFFKFTTICTVISQLLYRCRYEIVYSKKKTIRFSNLKFVTL